MGSVIMTLARADTLVCAHDGMCCILGGLGQIGANPVMKLRTKSSMKQEYLRNNPPSGDDLLINHLNMQRSISEMIYGKK